MMKTDLWIQLKKYLPLIILVTGIILWKIGGYRSNQAMAEIIKVGNFQLIDVRSPGEYSMQSISGSVNIPISELNNRLAEVKEDSPVIVYCASGTRSAMAKGILQAKGFTVVNGGSIGNVQATISGK